MLDKLIVSQLNTANISIDNAKTKERLEEIWKNATSQERQKAVDLGGYKDTRSFNNALRTARISLRMTVAIAQIFNIDPLFISAESDVKQELTEENLNKIIENHGYGQYTTDNLLTIKKERLLNHLEVFLDGINEKHIIDTDKVSDEDFYILLKGMLIQDKIGKCESELRVELIKLLLLVS